MTGYQNTHRLSLLCKKGQAWTKKHLRLIKTRSSFQYQVRGQCSLLLFVCLFVSNCPRWMNLLSWENRSQSLKDRITPSANKSSKNTHSENEGKQICECKLYSWTPCMESREPFGLLLPPRNRMGHRFPTL